MNDERCFNGPDELDVLAHANQILDGERTTSSRACILLVPRWAVDGPIQGEGDRVALVMVWNRWIGDACLGRFASDDGVEAIGDALYFFLTLGVCS